MSWETGDQEAKWTRRQWVRMGMTVAGLGTLAAAGAGMGGQLLPPPKPFRGEVRDTIQYTRFPSPQWWNPLDGQPVRVTDFGEWQGATGVWRGLFLEDELVPFTGFPVLIIRIKRDLDAFQEPAPADLPGPLPEGFSLYYDDPEGDPDPDTGVPRGVRIVVCFDRCVHLCCFPGWDVVENPPPLRDYQNFLPGEDATVETPTWYKYGKNPIYCVCHGSQYEPMNLVVDENPKNHALYVGARRVHGPATRALPVIPVRVDGNVLVGGMPDPKWYVYC